MATSSGPLFDHVVDTLPAQSSGPMFDHEIEDALILPGVRGPQVKQQDITLDRLAQPTSSTIATNVNILLTATGDTQLFTATQKTYILGVILRVNISNTVTVPPQVSIGVSPSTDNVFANEALINFDADNDLYTFWNNLNTATVLNASDVLQLTVNTAATATTLLAVAYVVGVVL